MSTSTTMHLQQLQADLDAAQRQAAASDREQAIENLALKRSQIREAEAEFTKLEIEIKAEDAQCRRLRQKLLSFDDAIGDSLLRRPECADYLPNDPEVRAWQKAHNTILKEQERTIAALKALPNTDVKRMSAIRLHNSITQLRYAERSILAKLSGDRQERNWYPV